MYTIGAETIEVRALLGVFFFFLWWIFTVHKHTNTHTQRMCVFSCKVWRIRRGHAIYLYCYVYVMRLNTIAVREIDKSLCAPLNSSQIHTKANCSFFVWLLLLSGPVSVLWLNLIQFRSNTNTHTVTYTHPEKSINRLIER